MDSDGDGLPNWWEIKHGLDPNNPDTGNTGVSDGYKDSDNDGWTNLQEYQNGTSPWGFNTPPAPKAWAQIVPNTFHRVIQWEASPGNVQNYRLVKYQLHPYNFWWSVSTQILSAATLSVTDPNPHFLDTTVPGDYLDAYSLTAVYPSQSSIPAIVIDQSRDLELQLIRGPGSAMNLAFLYAPSQATGVRIYLETNNACGWGWGTNQTFDLPLSAFTNRIYTFSEAQYPLYAAYTIKAQAVIPGGVSRPPQVIEPNCERCIRYPYLDTSSAMKGNLLFALQGQNLAPHYMAQTEAIGFGFRPGFTNPMPTYAVASFHPIWWYYYPGFYEFQKWSDSASPLHPIEINYQLANLVYQNSDTSCWGLNTGNWGTYTDGFWAGFYGLNYFDVAGFTSNQITTPCSSMLATPPGRLISAPAWTIAFDTDSPLINNSGNWSVKSVYPNAYGLALEGVYGQYENNGQQQYGFFPAGTSCPPLWWDNYPRYAAPNILPENFVFTRGGQITDIKPETCFTNGGIYVTNLLIASAGDPNYSVSAWIRYRLTNGNANVYGYMERYWDKAYKTTNGVVTTNQTGLLSPYGEFFPTEPGRTALVTMPDVDTGARGTATVYVVKMELDVNHDGTIDRTFAGPDNTSITKPFRFWINDDNDSYNGEESDFNWRRDCDDNTIGSQRDLEDFARLWITGLPSQLTNNEYTVTLGWRNYLGNPKIKIYPAAEADGGNLYLQNATAANAQIAFTNNVGMLTGPGACLATNSPNAPFTFPTNFFATFGRKHFLFEAAGIGAGELVLTVKQGTNVLAETSVFMDLIHIKNMYEQGRAKNVTSGIPPSSLVSELVVDRTVNAVADESKQFIVFVHGINNSEFGYQSSTETLFKRLYWSGYQGRVAGFRWPCAYLPDDDTVNPAEYLKALNFNKGEFYAWKSANAFKLYLQYITNRLAGYQINILAHSQGSVVASEAIKQGAPFDNLILSQGAIPAHCYDTSTNVPFLTKFLQAESDRPTPLFTTNGGYHGYFQNLTGNLVNFFNPQDYALATGKKAVIFDANWEANHIQRKPETFAGFSTSISYGYSTQSYASLRVSGNGLIGLTTNVVTDPHEIMGVVARTRTAAVGAQSGVGGVINTTNSVNLQTSFNFGLTRDEHSAQFTRPVQNVLSYYQAINSRILPPP